MKAYHVPQVNMLIKYLVNSLQSYESDHSDAMNPQKSESQTLNEQALQSQGLLLLNDKLDTFLSKITESIANTHLSSQSQHLAARIEPSICTARASAMPYVLCASSVDSADSYCYGNHPTIPPKHNPKTMPRIKNCGLTHR